MKLLFRETNSLMCEIKTADAYEDSSSNKEMLDFSIIRLSQNTRMIQTNQQNER